MTLSLIPFFIALGASVAFASFVTPGKRLIGQCSVSLCYNNTKEDLCSCFSKHLRAAWFENLDLMLQPPCLLCIRGINSPSQLCILHISPYFYKIYKFTLFPQIFCLIYIFCIPYFDLDAFTFHALHVLDAPALDCYCCCHNDFVFIVIIIITS